MLRNLIDPRLHPETGKQTCDHLNNNVCRNCYRAETRWGEIVGSHPAIPLTSIWIQKLSESSQSLVPTKNRLRCGHRKSFNSLSICSFRDSSSVLERGNWNCTEDYITMRGLLNFVFDGCKTINQIIRKHRKLNKKSKICKLGSAISWSLSWTT